MIIKNANGFEYAILSEKKQGGHDYLLLYGLHNWSYVIVTDYDREWQTWRYGNYFGTGLNGLKLAVEAFDKIGETR